MKPLRTVLLAAVASLVFAAPAPAAAEFKFDDSSNATAAAASKSCSVNNNQEGEPGISKLRAIRTTCKRARQVAAALRKAARMGELERRPVAGGKRFKCKHPRRNGANGEYFATSCVSGTRKVNMQYYATGLVD